MARSLAQTADPRDALARALRATGQSLGWRLGAVWESVPDRPEALTCVETWHAFGIPAEEFEVASRRITLASGEGLPGRVWESGEPAWIPDVLADDNFPRAPAARRAGLHAAFCFPIRSARGVLGVIEFFTGEARQLDPELLRTMSAIGDQIGQAVERRRDAEALRAKEARHRAMLEAALDCVVTMDHEGCVIDFNPAAERTFGHAAADVVGRDMAELIIPPELRERHRRGLARYIASEEPVLLDRRLEITGLRADGTTFPVELTITRIDLPGPPTFTGYLRDITDRKAAEAELRASRARIVEAADEARRLLERDLHDGAQQRLVELALDLRMARMRLDDDEPAQAQELLDAALSDLEEATRELRELARGIHPAVLTEGGLRPALEALTGRSSIPARLVAVPDARFAAPVEATAYFSVAEGLTNAARHAAAANVEVEVVQVDTRLRVEVRDDGRGGAETAAGMGLRGLADRVAALDGEVDVVSPQAGGTVLRVEIPCGS
ncbi:MAG TPA: PAS domain S-box protein [Thermoleophilaceae bacterium]